MGSAEHASPLCAKCGSSMVTVEAVAVLASLEGHAIYECVWCRHVLLVPEAEQPAAAWLLLAPSDVRRRVTTTS